LLTSVAEDLSLAAVCQQILCPRDPSSFFAALSSLAGGTLMIIEGGHVAW
jgi:hypothetical protein